MQTLCKSNYQDVYRVKDGVLLLINKFEYAYKDGYRKRVNTTQKNAMTYANGCKDLKKVIDKIDNCDGSYTEVGQVLYHGYPVKLTSKQNWNYQIKTTGDMFSGNLEEIATYIDDIIDIINKK